MEIRDFNDKLLNAKKARFLAAVKVAAEHIGANPPEVKFWDDTCPYDGGTEWAHIHLEYNIICVSKNRLQQMTYDKIDETATHEVTHLLEADHGTGFHKEHENVKLASWRPPGGLVVIDEHSGSIAKEKQKAKDPVKIDKIRCNYHLCRKKEKLKICPYCGRYLCTKHFNPIEPRIPSSYTTGRDDIVRDADLGHPCPDWVTFKEEEKKKQDEKYSDALKNLVKKSPEKERYTTYEPISSYKRPYPYKDIVIAAILVLVGLGIWYFFFR